MTYKKLILALVAASVVATGAFASGNRDDDNGRRDRPERDSEDRPDRDAMMEERLAELLEDAETYEGTFTMVDDEYPAIVDEDGNTWYLMARGLDEDNIPEEGAEVTVTAVTARNSPVHLMVLEAEVDGEVLEIELGGPMGREEGGGGRPGGPAGKSRR